MDRRKFLGTLGGAALLTALPLPVWSLNSKPKKGQVDLPSLRKFGRFQLISITKGQSEERSISILNSGSTRADEIPLGIPFGHTAELSSSLKPRYALVTGTDQTSAVVVDLFDGRVIARTDAAVTGWVFSGHAAFSPDKQHILVPEYPKDAHEPGHVVVRTAKTLKEVKRFTTGSYRPHSLQFTKDRRHLMVGHYGKPKSDGGVEFGAAKFFDWPSLKPVATELDQWPNVAHCHIAQTDNDFALVSTRDWGVPNSEGRAKDVKAPVLIGNLKKNKWQRVDGENFIFNFSASPLGRDRVLVNHSNGKQTSVWSKDGLVKMLDLGGGDPLANGSTPDGKFFFVTTNPDGKFHVFNAQSLEKVEEVVFPGIGSSPHIVILPV